MLQLPAGRDANQDGGSVEYERHHRNRPFFTKWSKNTIPLSRRSGLLRARDYRITCSGSSRTTSNAAAWNPVFFVFGAARVTPNAWWRSVANGADMRSKRKCEVMRFFHLISVAPRLKMQVQAGKKAGKQPSERTTIG